MVDIIAKKLVKKMKNFAPDFSINTCYRSIKISNIYSYTLKPKIELMETANCIYHFQCECASNYIGQSKRRLKVRAGVHQQKSRKTSIYSHIDGCKEYKKKMLIKIKFYLWKSAKIQFYNLESQKQKEQKTKY